jgi:hypothetical protein
MAKTAKMEFSRASRMEQVASPALPAPRAVRARMRRAMTASLVFLQLPLRREGVTQLAATEEKAVVAATVETAQPSVQPERQAQLARRASSSQRLQFPLPAELVGTAELVETVAMAVTGAVAPAALAAMHWIFLPRPI